VKRTLKELPETLDATYERILREIPKVNRDYAHRLLRCLAAADRPLAVEELAEILAIDFSAKSGIPKLNEEFRPADQAPEQVVLAICSSLVVIVNDRGSRQVQFSHYSVLQFLTSDRLAKSESSALSYYHIERESAHIIMAQACLGALLGLNDQMDKETIESYPLAEYAGEHFVAHARVGEVLSKISNGVDDLLDPDKSHFNTWLWLQNGDWDSEDFDLNLDSSSDLGERHYDQSDHEHPKYPPRVSPLYYTLLLGHSCLAQRLIRNRPRDLGTTNICGRTALHIAVFRSDFEAIRMLIERNADINGRDEMGCTPLHYAMHDDDQESRENFTRCVGHLLKHGADVEAQNKRGSTPLHLAASRMSEKTVQFLIENNPDINIDLRNNNDQTALHKASQRGHLHIVRLLLDNNADPNLQDNYRSTPLHLGAHHMSPEAVQLFLEHDADIALRNDKGRTALHQASQRGHFDIIRLILDNNGANVDARDDDGSTPLLLAVSEAEALSGAELLLDHGADIEKQNNNGQTALHLVSQRGRLDFMQLLLDRGAIVDALDINGFTPLHLAIAKMDRFAAELLLKYRANVYLRDDKGQTALHRASHRGDLLFMGILLTHGADVNALDNDGSTPLDLAVSELNKSAAELLLNHGANIEGKNKKDQTVLHLASQRSRLNIMQLLLERGANVDALDCDDSTPLHLIVSKDVESPSCAQLLLDHRADVNLRNNKGQTTLHLISQRDHLNIMKLLLERGGTVVDVPDNDGSTPLDLAISEKKKRATEMLLKHGAKIDLRDSKGQTALHRASQRCDSFAVSSLLYHGAHIDALDGDDSTPLHLAVSQVNPEFDMACLNVVSSLLGYGANPRTQNNRRETPIQIASARNLLHTEQLLRFREGTSGAENTSRDEQDNERRVGQGRSVDARRATTRKGATRGGRRHTRGGLREQKAE